VFNFNYNTNNFGGTKLKRNYIRGHANKELEYHWSKVWMTYHSGGRRQGAETDVTSCDIRRTERLFLSEAHAPTCHECVHVPADGRRFVYIVSMSCQLLHPWTSSVITIFAGISHTVASTPTLSSLSALLTSLPHSSVSPEPAAGPDLLGDSSSLVRTLYLTSHRLLIPRIRVFEYLCATSDLHTHFLGQSVPLATFSPQTKYTD
jgi:hypothetical protein